MTNIHTPNEIDDEEDNACQFCGGDGVILSCCDDACRGIGYCLHGDGYSVCHHCNDNDKK